MQPQPVDLSTPRTRETHTSVQATDAVREAGWDLSNIYPGASQSTIDSVIDEVLEEGSTQLSKRTFSTDYHGWDDLFLLEENLPGDVNQQGIIPPDRVAE